MKMAKQPKLSKGYLTDVMNGIIQNIALPILNNKGFTPSPFVEEWYGKNNLRCYVYYLFRINERSEMEYLYITACRLNLRIDMVINVFQPIPRIESLNALEGHSIFPFILPPNSLSQMELGSEEYGRIPIFRIFQEDNLSIGVPKSENDLIQRKERLSKTIEQKCTNIDKSFLRWHKRHSPSSVDWKGVPIAL